VNGDRVERLSPEEFCELGPRGRGVNCGRADAFAKVNLCLFLGCPRADGRHELVTLFESVGLNDRLVITRVSSGSDEVICPGVSGPNLVTDALTGLRAAGWQAPPVRVQIEKRIPVAAGMGGGSADAAAMLRFAPALSPLPMAALAAIAARLGADVPGQLDPGPSVGTGAGEVVAPVGDLHDHSLLVLPQSFGLSTADVYRQADALGLARSAGELSLLLADLQATLADLQTVRASNQVPAPLPGRLIVNDLQPAALSLAPKIGVALRAAGDAGAEQTLVCGSGPTVIGVFWGLAGFQRAQVAAEKLRPRFPGAEAVGVVRRAVRAAADR
jgi:4-diphosphocytidyl-2-C-methyl-D-erythritol kinase